MLVRGWQRATDAIHATPSFDPSWRANITRINSRRTEGQPPREGRAPLPDEDLLGQDVPAGRFVRAVLPNLWLTYRCWVEYGALPLSCAGLGRCAQMRRIMLQVHELLLMWWR